MIPPFLGAFSGGAYELCYMHLICCLLPFPSSLPPPCPSLSLPPSTSPYLPPPTYLSSYPPPTLVRYLPLLPSSLYLPAPSTSLQLIEKFARSNKEILGRFSELSIWCIWCIAGDCLANAKNRKNMITKNVNGFIMIIVVMNFRKYFSAQNISSLQYTSKRFKPFILSILPLFGYQ